MTVKYNWPLKGGGALQRIASQMNPKSCTSKEQMVLPVVEIENSRLISQRDVSFAQCTRFWIHLGSYPHKCPPPPFFLVVRDVHSLKIPCFGIVQLHREVGQLLWISMMCLKNINDIFPMVRLVLSLKRGKLLGHKWLPSNLYLTYHKKKLSKTPSNFLKRPGVYNKFEIHIFAPPPF